MKRSAGSLTEFLTADGEDVKIANVIKVDVAGDINKVLDGGTLAGDSFPMDKAERVLTVGAAFLTATGRVDYQLQGDTGPAFPQALVSSAAGSHPETDFTFTVEGGVEAAFTVAPPATGQETPDE